MRLCVAAGSRCISGERGLRSFRLLENHQKEYSGRVQFVGVAVDSLASAWRRAVDALPSNWLHVLNGKGAKDFANQLGVFTLPTRFLIHPSGRIVGRFTSRDNEFFNRLAEIGK